MKGCRRTEHGCRAAFLALLLTLCAMLLPSPALAEIKTVESEGAYTMEGGLEESPAIAKARARENALRNASNQAGVFVESIFMTRNSRLTRDEVHVISSTVLDVRDETFSTEVAGSQSIRYHCRLTATVDTTAVTEQLQRSKEDLDAAVQRNKLLEEENAKIAAEIENLKQQFAQAANDAERATIRAKARLNEASFSGNELVRQGNILRDRGALRQAIECYQQALALSSQSAIAYFSMGFAYQDLKDYENAMRCYQQALALGLDYAGVHAQLGGLYWRQTDYTRAVAEYDRAIAEIHDNASLYAMRGYCHELLHNYGEAIADYEDALRLNPGQKLARDGMERIQWLME